MTDTYRWTPAGFEMVPVDAAALDLPALIIFGLANGIRRPAMTGDPDVYSTLLALYWSQLVRLGDAEAERP